MGKYTITIEDVEGGIEVRNNFKHLELRFPQTPAEKAVFNAWLIARPYLMSLVNEQQQDKHKDTLILKKEEIRNVGTDRETLHS